MVMAFDLPEGSTIIKSETDRLFVVFDEKKANRDLWQAYINVWVVKGVSIQDFVDNKLECRKALVLTHKNKLELK